MMQGNLASIDLADTSPLHHLLLSEAARPMRTISEHDFGLPLCELYAFRDPEGDSLAPIFACPYGRGQGSPEVSAPFTVFEAAKCDS